MTSTAIAPAAISPRRPVPDSIPRPEYVDEPAPAPFTGSEVKDAETIERMRVAGRLARRRATGRRARRARRHHRRAGPDRPRVPLRPRRLPVDPRLQGLPEVAVLERQRGRLPRHPGRRVLEDGDIVNIDITAYIDGVHGDTNATFLAGDVDEETRLLVERTREALARRSRRSSPGRGST
jgi:methionyl aminopeptidase